MLLRLISLLAFFLFVLGFPIRLEATNSNFDKAKNKFLSASPVAVGSLFWADHWTCVSNIDTHNLITNYASFYFSESGPTGRSIMGNISRLTNVWWISNNSNKMFGTFGVNNSGMESKLTMRVANLTNPNNSYKILKLVEGSTVQYCWGKHIK